MDEVQTIPPADDQAVFELGEMIGRRQAFGTIAGRCSAADAECLRRMRDEKLFLTRAETWFDFCPKYLGLSSRAANRVIRNLEEFGPAYFELAQLTRISPEDFRAIAPAVRDRHLHAHGEVIALISENAEKVAAAVAELRRDTTPAAQAERDAFTSAHRHCKKLLEEIHGLVREQPHGASKLLLRSTIREAVVELRALDLQMGL
ncbi:MAG TPA: hypothetical protein VMB03_00665 [Bryobacteraceae bacterium]|nr:hypothetical protein [Bryobacteraceae bacterium]